MNTGDYDPTVAQLITTAHAQVIRAQLSHPAVGLLDLPLTASSSAIVTFDEARSPRVEASVTTADTPDLAPVDARTGWRLQIDAGYRLDDGTEDVQPFVDLGVRKSPRNALTAQLQLAAMSDEALVIDASPAVAEKVTAASPAAAASDLLGKCLSPAPWVAVNLPTTGGAVTIDPVEDRWAALADLADRYEAQAYDDGLRTWRIAPAPTATSSPDHELRAGVGGTVVEPERDVDRDAWANYVLLRYRWRNAAGADQQIVATAYVSSGDYAITGPAGRRIFRDDREVSTTQAAANTAARAVLARQLSRAETRTITAVAAYWLRPGMTVRVVELDGSTDDVLVARVAFDLVAGTMTVTTRRPWTEARTLASAPIDTTTPPPDPGTPTTPKPPVADPAPPAKQRYVTEWPASSTTVYRSNGTKRTDVDAGAMWQGTFAGSYNGNQRSIALFTGANSRQVPGKRSEVGVTIDAALAGVAPGDVERVELVATMAHTWAKPPAGSHVVLGYYNGTTAPATAPALRPYVTARDWPKGTTRAVNLTSPALARALVAKTCRAINTGPAPSSSTSYYAELANVRLRITYAK